MILLYLLLNFCSNLYIVEIVMEVEESLNILEGFVIMYMYMYIFYVIMFYDF